MPSLAVQTLQTDPCRQRVGYYWIIGKAFIIDKFSVGSGGHDPLDPKKALTPKTSLTTCPQVVFGPETIDDSRMLTPFCPEFLCVLEKAEAVAELSNICLIATVTYSPIPADPEVGTQFLFSIGNFPLAVKVSAERKEFRVSIQVG